MMVKLSLPACLMLAALMLAGSPSSGGDIYHDTAEKIRTTLEESLFTLPPDIQEHYAVRMYRITGNDRYLYSILYNLRLTLDQFMVDADSLADSSYVRLRVKRLMDQFDGDSRKNRYRRKLFEDAGFMVFYLDLLHTCNKIREYDIPSPDIRDADDRVVAYLRKVDFTTFLTDHDVIRIYAAQAVNYIYYLYDLGIADLRDQYQRSFREVFPDGEDDYLSRLEYKDKVYGLTHFIFAASGYYQKGVDSSDFGWILDYFSKNIDRITQETKEDIVAEVGLCFCLAGRENDPAAQSCRDIILSSVDSDRGLIPSVSGDYSIEKGEHRNVLAIMLLACPGNLHPGPSFRDMPDCYRDIFPEQ